MIKVKYKLYQISNASIARIAGLMRKFKFPGKVKNYMRYLTGVINNKANTLKKYLFYEKSFF